MTPRGVQVWFQNRRAKTKQQIKKAEAANGNPSKSSSSSDTTAAAASSNPPIAPRPDGDQDECVDGQDGLDDDPSALPPSPLPPSAETAPGIQPSAADTAPAPSNATANNASAPDVQQSNSTPASDSRRASLTSPLPHHPAWQASSSPSASTAPALPPPSSALSSPSPAAHVNAHVRTATHPPTASSPYSHSHLAPTDIYARRTSLPPSLHNNNSNSNSNGLSPNMGLGMLNSSVRRRGGFDPNARRRSTDMGGHRIVAHPYISVAQNANGPHHLFSADAGEDGAHPHPLIRRPMLPQRMTAPYPQSLHAPGAQSLHHPPHSHSHPVLPSQSQRPQPHPRPHYDMSPVPLTVSHSQGYPGHAPNHGAYDFFAPRHSIDGSSLGLAQAHAQIGMGLSPLHGAPPSPNGGASGAYNNMSLGVDPAAYAVSQRPAPAPIPGPLPPPDYQFGNPFAPASTSASTSAGSSASGTPPNAASPPLLSLRRTSEGGVSDGDTEESSGPPLSRFGSIASINGSEASWTSAYLSDGGAPEANGDEGDLAGSRKMSCASEFLGMFSDLEVGSNGGTPAPHSLPDQHQLRHATSSSHLSPNAYAAHQAQAQVHSPDLNQRQQQQHMQCSPEVDGYPSPSSASTVSAGSNHGNGGQQQQHTLSHDTTTSGTGSRIQGQNHLRTNTSSELAYALQGEPEPPCAYQRPQAGPSKDDGAQLQYPIYAQQQQQQQQQMSDGADAEAGESADAYGYAQDQARQYAKGPQPLQQPQLGHFPTVYEGYVYSHDGRIPEEEQGSGAMNEAYAAGAIELSHMCVPASEGVHFMGGYMQYS
ncbi:hypothetical protein BD413DRAFT_604948 [Trametes elegans]|nr:hypothetical protein BD413DRAFT_604948 [Trametes elegans]